MGALIRRLPASLSPLAALALTLTTSNDAAAQVVRTVPLQRAAPFDAWCRAPVCTPPGGALPPPALFKPPAVVLPSRQDGLLEQELKQRLAKAVSDQARELDLWSKPVADLSNSAAAAITVRRVSVASGPHTESSVSAIAAPSAQAIPAKIIQKAVCVERKAH